MDEAIATVPVPLSKERVVIVTGANRGLGYEVAKGVARAGATVIIACRSEDKARDAIQQIKREFEEEKKAGNHETTDALKVEFMKLDLESFQSVLDFVEQFKQSGRKLHVLFCNAGIGLQRYAQTTDGHERTLQINYLGHFVLIAKLLPIMHQSGRDCRILLMSSESHTKCNFDLATIEYTGPPGRFPGFDYYGRSKLYQIMQMYSMSRRLSGSTITVNCVDPGVVKTGFGDNMVMSRECVLCCTICSNIPKYVCGLNPKPDEAVRCSIDCVVNPELEGVTDVLFVDFKHRVPSAKARDVEAQEALWKKTFEMIMQMYCMVRRLSGSHITVTCFCPGMTKTEFGEGVELHGCCSRFMWCCVRTIGKTPEKAARICIDCSVNPKYDGVTGVYYESDKRTNAANKARDEKNQEAVWNKTFELVGQHITAEEMAVMEGQSLKL